MTLKTSFAAIRYYTAADPYHYTIDNRPLTDVKTCLDFLADTMDAGFSTTVLTVTALGFSATQGAAIDLELFRDGANILAQRNGVTAQSFRIYNTFTDAANNERGTANWTDTANTFTIGTTSIGTGVARPMELRTAGTSWWQLTTAGNIIAKTDNTIDIGASGATRPRTLYLGTSLDVATGAVTLGSSGPQIVATRASGNAVSVRVTQSGVAGWDFRNVATTGTLDLAESTAGTQLRLVATASAVDFVQISGGATANPATVTISAQGTDTNIHLAHTSKGTGAHNFNTGGGLQVAVLDTSTSTRSITLTGSNGANPVVSTTAGSLAVGTSLVFVTDNTFDIGNTATLRPRSGYFAGRLLDAQITITYSASMTIDAATGNDFIITATNGTAFTINAPTNPLTGQFISIIIRNTSGGALGVATWNAVFKMTAWTQPGTATSRCIYFAYDGTNWVERGRTTVDVPN